MFRFSGIIGIVVALVFTILQAGNVKRDKEVLHDIAVFNEIVPKFSVVTVPPELFSQDWELQCYWMRYHNVSLDYSRQNRFFLQAKSWVPYFDLSAYKKLDLETKRYDLYVRRSD